MGEKTRKNYRLNKCWMAMQMIPTAPKAVITPLDRGQMVPGYEVDDLYQ